MKCYRCGSERADTKRWDWLEANKAQLSPSGTPEGGVAWCVETAGQDYGPHDTARDAIDAARRKKRR